MSVSVLVSAEDEIELDVVGEDDGRSGRGDGDRSCEVLGELVEPKSSEFDASFRRRREGCTGGGKGDDGRRLVILRGCKFSIRLQ